MSETPDPRSLVKLTKPFPPDINDLEKMKKDWENENEQYTTLTAYLRHQFTNYEDVLLLIPDMVELDDPSDDEKLYRWTEEIDTLNYGVKFRASYLVREELNRKYGININPMPYFRW